MYPWPLRSALDYYKRLRGVQPGRIAPSPVEDERATFHRRRYGIDMAGDWIKVESATADKPEVLRIARTLNVPRVTAFGAVVMFWAWLDRNSETGAVDGVVDADVDGLVGLPGFCDAMRAVHWLKLENERLSIPHFERLNGQTAKNRSLKNERQARWRAGKTDPPKAPEAPPKPKRASRARKPQTTLPEGFSVSESVKTWAAAQGFEHLEMHLTKFILAATAKGYVYADWDAAFKKAIADDWAGLRTPKHPDNGSSHAAPIATTDWREDRAEVIRRATEAGVRPDAGESIASIADRVMEKTRRG